MSESAKTPRGRRLTGEAIAGAALALIDREGMAALAGDDETLALDEIKAVGPGGNHLARPYTRKHFRRIWQSDLFDTTRHDAWEADGAKTLLDRLKARGSERSSATRALSRSSGVSDPSASHAS